MSYRQKLRFSQAFLTLLLRPFPQGLHVFTLDFGHTQSKTDPLKLMLRGIRLLMLGFALNLFRFTMPLLVAMLLLDSGELQLTGDNTLVKLSFYVDILQLAGLSLIFCALLKKIAVPRKSILLLIFIILFVSPFLWGLFEGNLVSDLFWGEADNVAFPFFPWAVYPLLGISLSQCLTDSSVLDQNLKKSDIVALF